MLIKKIPDVNGLVTTTVLNTKINIENKIPDTGGLVSATVLNTKVELVKNKIPCVSVLVKKTIMTLKYQIWSENNLLLLIITNFWVTYLMQK